MMPKNLFTYWEGPMPPIIAFCLQSIRERSGVDVVVMDASTERKYSGNLLNPNYCKISNIAQKVDLIRLAVLFENGGMWCDADTIVLKSLEPLFDRRDDFCIMRWKHNGSALNGYFLAAKKSAFLKKCIDLANKELTAGRPYYNSPSGCYFGEDLFRMAGNRDEKTEIPLETLLPVKFPENAHIWETHTTIMEYVKPITLAVGLNHSHMPDVMRSSMVESIERMPNLIGSVVRYYRYGAPEAFVVADGDLNPWPTELYLEAEKMRPKPIVLNRAGRREIKAAVHKAPEAPTRNFRDGKLCIMTAVDAAYAGFVPLWAACIRRAAPTADVVVIARNCMVPETAGVTVCEQRDKLNEHNRVTASLRFLVGDGELDRYDYVLITDADILFYREQIPVMDQHVDAMERDGTGCYENWLLETTSDGPRLLGVHFVTREWWAKTETARRAELAALEGRDEFAYQYDEVMLGRIVRDSGLALPPAKTKMWRNHGIHLGPWRRLKGNNSSPQISGEESLLISWLFNDESAKSLLAETVSRISDLARVVHRWRAVVK